VDLYFYLTINPDRVSTKIPSSAAFCRCGFCRCGFCRCGFCRCGFCRCGFCLCGAGALARENKDVQSSLTLRTIRVILTVESNTLYVDEQNT
jgi:hypothetical protein